MTAGCIPDPDTATYSLNHKTTDMNSSDDSCERKTCVQFVIDWDVKY